MTTLEPFAVEHLDGAAALLARLHAEHCAAEPLLERQGSAEALEEAWRRPGTSGAVALRDGEVAGYVIGSVAERRHFGRSVWVERAGHAAADGELAQDLYAAAAQAWVDAGARRQLVLVPALPRRLEPWYALGFAQMHVHGGRAAGAAQEARDGLVIRRGGPDDVEAVAIPVNALIADLQARSPSFASLDPSSPQEERDSWLETLAEPGSAYLVAERQGRPVGHALLYPADRELGVPADAVYLASTAVAPEARGGGVGTALCAHALAWAQEAGYGSVVTGWRASNLSASRFWPRRGFRPAYLRLTRLVGTG